MSLDEFDFFSEYNNYGSGSGTHGKSVGSAGDVGFGVFVLIGIESLGNVVILVVFVPRGVDSKGVIVVLFLHPTHSIRCSFTNKVATGEPVGSMCLRANYGSEGKDGPKFIRCVDGL